MLAALLACATPSPLVGDTLTEDGTWRLVLDQTTYDQGQVSIQLAAYVAQDATPATGLDVMVRPDMPDMDHLLDLVYFLEEEAGSYTTSLLLDMPGLWTLTGYAQVEEHAESFTFVVEALP